MAVVILITKRAIFWIKIRGQKLVQLVGLGEHELLRDA